MNFNLAASFPMTVDEWLTIPDNGRQRNTEKHLERAVHLRAPSPAHAFVYMAQAPDGRRWKLDGHTRALAWRTGRLERPARLIVNIISVKNEAEARDLYRHFDNKAAVESSEDQIYGAFRECGIVPQSKLLARCGITNALRLAEGCRRGARKRADDSIYGLVALWKPQIEILDSINPSREKFPGPILAAALMTTRKHGPQAIEFWQKYQADAGEKLGDLMDGVEALVRLRLISSQNNKGGQSGAFHLIGRCLSTFEVYRRGDYYTQGAKATDPTRYLSEATVKRKPRKPADTLKRAA